MHIAGILGPGNLAKPLAVFQRKSNAQWTSLIEQADVIAIFGGDGTVHHHLKTLVELDVPLLVVPCGSGNDFARALGFRTLQDSLAAWHKFAAGAGNVKSIDLGVICHGSGSSALYFCCVAGVGLDSAINRRANSLPKWIRAHGGYGLSAPREFLRFQPFAMKIGPNGASPGIFKPTTLVAVANSPSYGGGMKIAPQAKLDDGKLDICIVRSMNKLSLFRLFPTVYSGQHLRSDKVEYAQAPSARVETESPLEVFADGEFVCRTPVEFTVAHQVLQVIVPE
ncbi:MAG TPA: diacylglycerol kinase family protein [Terriglobales bacterium]|nr:diacylglycerol kinase family protein [Terriglobales bacterium]